MFTLDSIDDTVIRLRRTYDSLNEIRFPKELTDLLQDEWVWEIYFDDMNFDDTSVFIDTGSEFITQISDEAMDQLGWNHGDCVTWTVRDVEEGKEVRVVKTDGE